MSCVGVAPSHFLKASAAATISGALVVIHLRNGTHGETVGAKQENGKGLRRQGASWFGRVGMELTKEIFDDFIARLRYHNQGGGVDEHCTANPIFLVQKRERVYGFDSDYVDDYVWINADNDHVEADERTAKRLDALDHGGHDIKSWGKVCYVDRWEYVSAHLTKEAAKAFIARKKNDYQELRVYVDCQYYCWEFNTIVEGLLSGKIGFKGE